MTAILILLCSMLSATHFISPLRDQDNEDIILVVQQDEAVTPAGAPRSIPRRAHRQYCSHWFTWRLWDSDYRDRVNGR